MSAPEEFFLKSRYTNVLIIIIIIIIIKFLIISNHPHRHALIGGDIINPCQLFR